MNIRGYRETDAQETLDIFLSAVNETAAAHYSTEQIAAWSRPEERELGTWNSARSRDTFVATISTQLVGFSDVSDDGYIDMMFVAPKFGRRGVASALLAHISGIAKAAGITELSTDASITARPFFERHGFAVVAEQRPITHGIEMINFRMTRKICEG